MMMLAGKGWKIDGANVGRYIHHWVITSLDRSRFSELCDSRSTIFDLDGWMGGVLEGTGSCYPSLDLIYLIPIAWIIEDIKTKAEPIVLL